MNLATSSYYMISEYKHFTDIAENTIDLFRRKLFTNVIIFYQELKNMFILACMTFHKQGLDVQSFIIPRPFIESALASTFSFFPGLHYIYT